MRLFLCGTLSLLLVGFAGCSGEKVNREAVFKVRGKVTYKGQPVSGADITFHNSTRSAFGRTDDQGEYQLTTFSSNDGAIEGKHGVSIVQLPPVQETPPLADTESDEYVPPEIGESTEPVTDTSMLPQKYAKENTSGLTAMVNADGENVVDFELKD